MIRQTLLYFAARVGTGFLAIALLATFTRMLAPADYGRYVLALTIATIASSVLFQWLVVSVGRFYARYADRSHVLISAVSRSFVVTATVASIVSILAAAVCWYAGVDMGLVPIVLLLTVAQGRYDLALQFANVRREPAAYAITSWSKTGIALLVGSALLFVWPNGISAMAGVAVGLIVAARWPKRVKHTVTPAQSPTVGLSREFIRYGSPLAANSLALMVVSQSDRLLIASILGVSSAAPYAAAYDLSQQSIGAIMNVVFLAFYPPIVQALEEKDGRETRDHLLLLARTYAVIGIPAVAGFAAIADEAAGVLFGDSFRHQAADLLPCLAIAIFISGLKAFYLDLPFQLKGQTKCQAYIGLLMAVTNVLLNLILLPRYGVLGAAWAVLVSFTVGAAVSWLQGKAIMRLPFPTRDFLKVIGASSVMLLAIGALPHKATFLSLVSTVCVGVCTYAASAYLFNVGGSRAIAKRSLGAITRIWGYR